MTNDAKREALAALADAINTCAAESLATDCVMTAYDEKTMNRARFAMEHVRRAQEALPALFLNVCRLHPEWMAELGRAPEIEVRELERLRARAYANVTMGQRPDLVRESEIITAIHSARKAQRRQRGVIEAALAEMNALAFEYGTAAPLRRGATDIRACMDILRKHLARAGKPSEMQGGEGAPCFHCNESEGWSRGDNGEDMLLRCNYCGEPRATADGAVLVRGRERGDESTTEEK